MSDEWDIESLLEDEPEQEAGASEIFETASLETIRQRLIRLLAIATDNATFTAEARDLESNDVRVISDLTSALGKIEKMQEDDRLRQLPDEEIERLARAALDA